MKQLAQVLTLPDGTRIAGDANFKFSDGNIGTILQNAIPVVFSFAGVGLLVMIIFAGFGMMTSAGDPKKLDKAKQQLTNAIIGFVIVFVAYWLVQLAGIIFGIDAIRSNFN